MLNRYLLQKQPAIMPPLSGSLLLCCIWTFVTSGQGMLFSLDTNTNDIYCGRLHCWADTIFSDSNVFSVYGLTVYDVTKSNTPIKLASLSVFDPILQQTETNITVTGNISRYHAELTLGLRDLNYCLNGSFLCELDFVHFNGNPDMIRETVTPGSSGNCPAVFNKFAQMAIQVKTHSGELENEIVELKKEVVALKTELNKALHAQVMCLKGMPYNNSRQVFVLWGKVAALCDTETDGGGWIIIQRRTKGDVDFYRNWKDYKNGFGTPDTDFWIGNEIIHNLTSHGYTEIRIDIEYQGRQYYAYYSYFTVDDETSSYNLSVSGYNGTTGDDGFDYNNGYPFSTYDRDNRSSYGCVSFYHGAWWYGDCTNVNLNGLWGAQNQTGLFWRRIKDHHHHQYFSHPGARKAETNLRHSYPNILLDDHNNQQILIFCFMSLIINRS